MSLEVDGRLGRVPIPSHTEDEGLNVDGHRTHWDHAQILYGEQPELDLQSSTSTQRPQKQQTGVPSRIVVFWSVTFCIFSVLAVVAAGVAGSIAARRGRNLSSWSVFLP